MASSLKQDEVQSKITGDKKQVIKVHSNTTPRTPNAGSAAGTKLWSTDINHPYSATVTNYTCTSGQSAFLGLPGAPSF